MQSQYYSQQACYQPAHVQYALAPNPQYQYQANMQLNMQMQYAQNLQMAQQQQLQQSIYNQQQQQLYNARLQQQQQQQLQMYLMQSQASSSQHYHQIQNKLVKKSRRSSNKQANKTSKTTKTTKTKQQATPPANSNNGEAAQPTLPVLAKTIKTELERCLSWIIYNDQIDDFAELLCDSHARKVFVVNQCARHSSSHASCIRWSKKWSLADHADCAQSVLYAMTQSRSNAQRSQNKAPRTFPDAIPMCAIDVAAEVLVVNDHKTFLEAKEVLLAETECIGLDMETMVKQFPITNAPKKCQILQIATSTKTLVIDLAAMPNKRDFATTNAMTGEAECVINPNAMDRLLCKVFRNKSVMKVGMSFDGDLKLLRQQYPAMVSVQTICGVRGYMELEVLLKFARSAKGKRKLGVCDQKEAEIKAFFAKSGRSKREGGLATIVRHVLRQRLEKTEQLSNWARRPLRLSQLAYAAMDAKCEVQIYNALRVKYPSLLKMCMAVRPAV